MLQFFKNWALPIAMFVGGLCYRWIIYCSFLTPWLIFAMLLLTFCKIPLKSIRITILHVWLLLIQLVGGLLVFIFIAPFDKLIAQGAIICFLAPTATAAAVITNKLGGKIETVTTYTLLSNILVALIIPILFPLIEQTAHPDFWHAFATILSRIFPLLICPFVVAELLRYFCPKVHSFLLQKNSFAFYLWTFSLTIVTAQTVQSIILQSDNPTIEISLGIVALIICIVQFVVGKAIGTKYNDRIAAGQSLGQKNTILAIWMAHTYLNPLSAIAPGAYVLWQNIINSWQLWRKRNQKTF